MIPGARPTPALPAAELAGFEGGGDEQEDAAWGLDALTTKQRMLPEREPRPEDGWWMSAPPGMCVCCKGLLTVLYRPTNR